MAYYELPDDAPQIVRDIHATSSADALGRQFNLIIFSTESLQTAYDYLGKVGMWINLQKELERELRLRHEAMMPTKKVCKNPWFEEMWWAVVSLYGKGKLSKSDAKTKTILKRIKPEWRYNCGGGSQ